MSPEALKLPHTKDDFVSNQQVRWCPGCGDYSILAMVQRTLAKLNIPKENYAFISGIGCSSRFPYYMNTYGFHTVHGRALAIASGFSIARPDLSTWVITGDGDALSIGGNHLLHSLRRNMDFKVLLVNNQIYGLTKGQCSPTSQFGKVTKSTPFGSIDHPIAGLSLALASGASFVARTLDTDPKHLGDTLERAAAHRGTPFVEIYQNCVIFNDKDFAPVTGRENREDRMIYLEDNKPLVFGKKRDRAIQMNGLVPEITEYKEGANDRNLLVHRVDTPTSHYAYMLSQLNYPEMPVPFGVFRDVKQTPYGELVEKQIQDAIKSQGAGDLKSLIYGGPIWRVD